MKKSHKLQDPNYVRLDVTIPKDLKTKLINYSNELGLNLKSTLIVILNEKLK